MNEPEVGQYLINMGQNTTEESGTITIMIDHLPFVPCIAPYCPFVSLLDHRFQVENIHQRKKRNQY